MPIALAVPFVAIAVALAAWTFAQSWDVTIGPMLRSLADLFDSVRLKVFGRTIVGLGFIAAGIRSLDKSARHWISHAIIHVSGPVTHLLLGIRWAFQYPAAQLAGLAQDVAQTAWRLRYAIVPELILARVLPLRRWLAAVAAKVDALAVRAPVHITKDITNYAKGAFQTITYKAVSVPWPRIRRVEREAGALGHRIDHLARRVTPAALAAAAALALAKIGAQWTRCSRSKRWGKNVCGMNDDILNTLITDTALIVGTLSLVDMVKLLQPATHEATVAVKTFWDA